VLKFYIYSGGLRSEFFSHSAAAVKSATISNIRVHAAACSMLCSIIEQGLRYAGRAPRDTFYGADVSALASIMNGGTSRNISTGWLENIRIHRFHWGMLCLTRGNLLANQLGEYDHGCDPLINQRISTT
jgi:hypothetical protein